MLFKTKNRNYTIIDAPGHIEFLKNMITGASRAEAALLVIDAYEGIQENTKRHGYMLSMLGIKQLCILVNKMDLISYSKDIYREIVEKFKAFLKEIGLEISVFIPISGYKGENLVLKSQNMPWYNGMTVLEALESFVVEKLPMDKSFRMPVQSVYKFTMHGDNRRIISGTVETGILNIDDEVIFFPSGKKSRVKSIEAFNEDIKTSVSSGYATGFTLKEQIFVKRGEIATIAGQAKPQAATRIKVKLFWLGKMPMEKGKVYYLKLGTAKVGAKVEEIISVLDASTLLSNKSDNIEKNDVAECVLKLEKSIAFDIASDNYCTSRFVIVDDYEISGGGLIYEALEDEQSWVRNKVLMRNCKWENSGISEEERSSKYKQKSVLIIITGSKDSGKKYFARALEKMLFYEGKVVYFLGIGNLLYGVDADIKLSPDDRKEEHLRRLGEISNMMLDAGNILIVTAVEFTDTDLEEIKTIINPEKIKVIWMGKSITTDIHYDLYLQDSYSIENNLNIVKDMLINQSVLL